ncbi:MAG: LptF/LptG family permease [Lentisphaeria bacterium]|nr:LptF/LptG family permease [Candidatus Neomarinimicrobiota bacterium]MCF7842021.1 LptF/LptG family permease [Lentisphaeria bacterium]
MSEGKSSEQKPFRLLPLRRYTWPVKKLDRYILRELFTPFAYSLLILTFIFLVNFLIRSMDRILGKGLSLWVILEFVGLNLAWMLALAIPMSVLVAVLLAYGRMASDHEITAMRSGGISLPRILRPALIFATVVAAFTIYFNNNILPDLNHRARLLGGAIYRLRPDLNIAPGYFIDDLPQYTLRVNEVTPTGLKNIVIFSKDNQESQVSIYADYGHLTVAGDRIIISLYDGEKHLLDMKKLDDYRRERFDSTRIAIPVTNMQLERTNRAARGDREMSSAQMRDKVRLYEESVEQLKRKIQTIYQTSPFGKTGDSLRSVTTFLDTVQKKPVNYDTPEMRDNREWNRTIEKIRGEMRIMESYHKQINRLKVEVHKKYAMPVACLVFVLIGAPLGIMTRKSSWTLGVAIGMFFIYWAFLIAGEELADRLMITPFMAMWLPNLIMGAVGLWISYQAMRERRVLSANWARFWRRRKQSDGDRTKN